MLAWPDVKLTIERRGKPGGVSNPGDIYSHTDSIVDADEPLFH